MGHVVARREKGKGPYDKWTIQPDSLRAWLATWSRTPKGRKAIALGYAKHSYHTQRIGLPVEVINQAKLDATAAYAARTKVVLPGVLHVTGSVSVADGARCVAALTIRGDGDDWGQV